MFCATVELVLAIIVVRREPRVLSSRGKAVLLRSTTSYTLEGGIRTVLRGLKAVASRWSICIATRS